MSIFAKCAVRQTKLKKRDKMSKTSKRYNEKQAYLNNYTVYVKISALTRTAWGLSKRTGVDYQTFNKNRMSGKPLTMKDRKVFSEGKEWFSLGSHDLARTLRHVGRAGNKKKRDK